MTMQDVLDFQRAAEAYGLIFDGLPIADGEEYRVSTAAKPKVKNGWYALHDDGNRPWGVFGDWAIDGGARQVWQAKGSKPITMAELQAMQAAAVARALAQAAEKLAKQESVAAEVRAMLAPEGGLRLVAEGDSTAGIAYLAGKGFDYCPSTVWLDGATLVLPMREAGGRVVNLQRIYREDGEFKKCYVKGARKAGCWMTVPGKGEQGQGPIAIAEGYATAATMAAASGFWTLAALDAGSLLAVARKVRELWPMQELVLVADDDWQTAGNPGVTKAREAAEAVGARLVVPEFGAEREPGDTDLNDAMQRYGLDAVAAMVARWLAVAPAPPVAPPVDAVAEAMRPMAPWQPGERPKFDDRPVLVWREQREARAEAEQAEPAADGPWQQPMPSKRRQAPLLHLGVSGMLAGAPGYGKTHLAARLAVTVAAGGEWVREPAGDDGMQAAWMVDAAATGAVLWVCAEDDRQEVSRRLWAACQRNADGSRASQADTDRKAKAVAERVQIIALADTAAEGQVLVRSVQYREPATGEQYVVARVQRLFDQVCELLQQPHNGEPWRLVMLDPMAELLATGAESESDTMREALRMGVHTLRRHGATVLVLHHTRKGNTASTGAGTDPAEMVRGSSAIVGSMRWVAVLHRPAKAKAGTVQLLVAKSNYASKAEPVWLKWSDKGEAWLAPCAAGDLPEQSKGKGKADAADAAEPAADTDADLDGLFGG